MKQEKIYIDRLTKLAKALTKVKEVNQSAFEHLAMEDTDEFIEVRIPYFTFIYDLCPVLFPGEWQLNEFEKPYWNKCEIQNTFVSAQEFFGISFDEFVSFSMPYGEIEGGKVLDKSTTPADIAFNIMQLIKSEK